MKFKMILGNFMCTMGEPKEIKFWIENEIGEYEGKSTKAEKWCSKALIGDVYDDEFIHIEVLEG